MKRNAMRKNLTQSIWKSLGRYIAIVAIIALGASMFVGLLMTKSDMVATGQKFMDEQNMFDLRLVSNCGWDLEHVEQIAQMEGVVDAEGLVYLDAVANLDGSDDNSVFRFYALPEKMNLISLRGGRMPQSPNECLIDGFHATDDILGATITVVPDNEESTLDAMVYDTYTIVGYIASPLYMDMNRGTTSVGSGSLNTYLYLPRECFDVDYYPEINLTIPGDYEIYSQRYNDAMDRAAEILEPQIMPIIEERFYRVKEDAVQEYHDGMLDYFEGQKKFRDGKAEAEQELADAHQKLMDAEQELVDAEGQIADGEQQLASAKNQLYSGQKELDAGREAFETQKQALYGPLEQTKALLEGSKGSIVRKIGEYETQIQNIDSSIAELDQQYGDDYSKLSELNASIATLDGQISVCQAQITGIQAALDFANMFPGLGDSMTGPLQTELASQQTALAEYQSERDALAAQRDALNTDMSGPNQQRQELENEKAELQSQLDTWQDALAVVETSLTEIENGRAALDEQFASAQAELDAAQEEINSGWALVSSNEYRLKNAKEELEQGKLDLEDAWKEYEEGKAEAEQEFADAEAELAEAKEKLADARDMIVEMKEPSLFVLDRSSNIGYGSLDSASDIVQGVSRVFPAFFLLVAALVCITTMTRMIDEERTQIGTLKALGYSNGAIISKYLIYAGSGAVVGCGLGVVAGSIVFPTILWKAYRIMLYISDDIVLQFNWLLCGIVVLVYTLVMLLVTWYCCRRALEEQPAELIRPKAPDAGKKILLERLPFWHRISFLNKVTIRNIFRYRQRLAMIMVGIGGCTALLLTGFGLRDSIVNVVNYQFEEVTVYDLQVYFTEGRTEEDMARFLEDVPVGRENVHFYYQESVELDANDQTKEIYMMVSDDGIEEFIDFHSGDTPLSMPGVNEMLLSVGAAEMMGINVGDQVQIRNPDLEMLELTVSGIYDNHVNNYLIITPQTLLQQWGAIPEEQMALVKADEDQDVHKLGAEIIGMAGVMNVSVSADLADMVGNMMEALDLVVWVVVFCAGLLAAIVLYNLTNININERIREIATIKVLGFNARETAAYVFKENLSLSAIGSVFGLGLGYLLLLFVMSQIKINMVWFKAVALPMSFVLSIVLTMVAACIVDFVFYFKLEKINMTEALKSVE